MAKVVTFLGTRPDIIKLSPLMPLLSHAFEHTLIHSGQHYTYEMDGVFFDELHLPPPDYNLGAGSDTQGRQIANIMIGLENVLLKESPQALIVAGGTNTALAGALVANKLDIAIAHLDAGVRTFNQRSPEDTNRILIDRMATWLFAPGESAREHLLAEGLAAPKISLAGSTTIDACRRNLHLAHMRPTVEQLGLKPNEYIVLTLHRAENTERGALQEIISAVNALSRIWPIVFPMHPRTRQTLGGDDPFNAAVKVIKPLGYLDMLNLVSRSRALLTDSSGLQEEAVLVGAPALILRNETEWPQWVESGANALVGNTYRSLMDRAWPILASEAALQSMRRKAAAPAGGATLRILRRLGHDLGTIRKLHTAGQPAVGDSIVEAVKAAALS